MPQRASMTMAMYFAMSNKKQVSLLRMFLQTVLISASVCRSEKTKGKKWRLGSLGMSFKGFCSRTPFRTINRKKLRIACAFLLWSIADKKGADTLFWAVKGAIFLPFAIPFIFLTKNNSSKSNL